MPLAQLDRVFGYEPKGRGFESLMARQKEMHSHLFFCLAPLGWNKPPVLLGEGKGFSKAKVGELKASPNKKLKKKKPSDIM